MHHAIDFRKTLVRRIGAALTLAAMLAAGLTLASRQGKADGREGEDGGDLARIVRGFAIAPVPLNLVKKNAALVGLGSYLVNAAGGCNDCHTNPSYTAKGDPYTVGVTKAQVNAAAYLAGGTEFGPFVSRNITPDKSGKPAGRTPAQFRLIFRTGADLSQWHPTLPSPLNGKVLQVMPWPVYGNLSDHDLSAMYEYLSAVPCLEGDPGNPAGSDTKGKRCK